MSNAFKKGVKPADTIAWYVPNWNAEGEDSPTPVFILKHATTDNKQFTAALLAYGKSPEGQKLARGGMSVSKMDEQRESDYKMFASMIVVGWGNVPADEPEGGWPPGTPREKKFVPFPTGNAAEIEKYLRYLGDAAFDDLRMAAREPGKHPSGDGLKALAGN